MARVGDKPVIIPDKVKIDIDDNRVTVTGPNGTIGKTFDPRAQIIMEGNKILVKVNSKILKALQGTVRAIINNMVAGAVKKFEKRLEIHGVGYKTQLTGQKLVLQVGYSHPVEFDIPGEIEVATENKGLLIILKSIDKEKLGLLASQIKHTKIQDPYKGKGIKYFGEYLKKKPGKSAIGAGASGG